MKIFRKIRVEMLKDSRIARYMLYALGEIILVVIGILIALQINNWNEERRTRQVEIDLLENLMSDLNASHASIEKMIFRNSKDVSSYSELMHLVQKDSVILEEYELKFGRIPLWATPYLTYSSYETLKTKGMDIIVNDTLRQSIVELYDKEFHYLMDDWDKWEWNNNQSIVMPFFTKHFLRDTLDLSRARPNDYQTLVKNKEYFNVLSLILMTRKKGVREGERINKKIEQLINDINKEIAER